MTTTREGPWWCKPGVRHRLEACKVPPMRLELPAQLRVTVSYAELQEHAGGAAVAAVLCVSGAFTSAQAGCNSMPNWTRLYTRRPQIVGLWPGDSLEFRAAKRGALLLLPMQPLALRAPTASSDAN